MDSDSSAAMSSGMPASWSPVRRLLTFSASDCGVASSNVAASCSGVAGVNTECVGGSGWDEG